MPQRKNKPGNSVNTIRTSSVQMGVEQRRRLRPPSLFMARGVRSRPFNQRGGGFMDFIGNVARTVMVDRGGPELFPGEQHGIIEMPNGKKWNAQYMGPGTQVATRLRRGDPGLSEVDKLSKAHDIRYSLARSRDDIDRADDIMLKGVNSKSDRPFNKLQARLIWPKRQLSRFGIKLGSTPGDPALDKDPNLKAMYQSELSKLEQRGYGGEFVRIEQRKRTRPPSSFMVGKGKKKMPVRF